MEKLPGRNPDDFHINLFDAGTLKNGALDASRQTLVHGTTKRGRLA
jgi:hypothetical protein